MIKPSDIVRHLKKYIGLFTDEFTDYTVVSSASAGVGNVITVLAPDHGLVVGTKVVLTGGTTRNILTGAEDTGDTVLFTTTVDHDLIEPSQPLDQTAISLVDLGTYDIATVPTRRTFSVAMDDVPVLTGQYLQETGPRGLQTVASVPDADTFTLTITDFPEMPEGILDDLEIVKGFRLAAAADFQRATAAYSSQSDPYLFVIMSDADTSKDRHTLNDGVAGFTRQDAGQLKIRQRFVTAVFFPTENDLSGVDAQDKAYDTMLSAQMSCLLGYGGEDDNVIQYLAVPTSHGSAGDYNTAYYAHSYSWEFTQVVDYQDGFLQWPHVAFRDIAADLAGLEFNINLDKES